uniref:Uncharacterized protein n=1 Tax=Brassica oleracea var. oleracea TaxID=109376 RepID=A0A0D3ANX3_BRAOL
MSGNTKEKIAVRNNTVVTIEYRVFSSGKRALRRSLSNTSSSLRRNMTEERDEKAGDCFSDDRKRCAWITPKSDQSCIAFHNEEWGVHVHDDKISQKTMNAHEAEAAAEQAVSKVEAAMTAAEEAAKEADAAEAARAYAEEASKTLKGKKHLQSGKHTLLISHHT